MISEKHLENDEIMFQNVYWHRESLDCKDTRDTRYILCVLLFVLWVPLHEERKRDVMLPKQLCGIRPIDKEHTNLSNM